MRKTNEVYNKWFDKITENKRSYTANKIYKHSEEDFWWYINTKGRLHVKKIVQRNYGDIEVDVNFTRFSMIDYLLTYEGDLKYSSGSNEFNSLEELMERLEYTNKFIEQGAN